MFCFFHSLCSYVVSLQYGSYQRAILAEDLTRKWKQNVFNASVRLSVTLVLFFTWKLLLHLLHILQDSFDCLCVQTITPLEHCQWLNKLLSEIWLNFMNKKLSLRFSSMVEVRFILSYVLLLPNMCFCARWFLLKHCVTFGIYFLI